MSEAFIPDRGDLVRIAYDRGSPGDPSGRRVALVLTARAYNQRAGLALVCPVVNRAKGYPFEVELPPSLPVRGVVLTDHVRSLDWTWRRAEPAGRVPGDIVNVVLERLGLLLKP